MDRFRMICTRETINSLDRRTNTYIYAIDVAYSTICSNMQTSDGPFKTLKQDCNLDISHSLA